MKPLLLIAILASAGCSSISSIRLPEINADTISYRRTDLAGGTQITATGVTNDAQRVTAERVTLVTTYPMFSVSVEVTGYSRKKGAE
jgi:hypothetical protein